MDFYKKFLKSLAHFQVKRPFLSVFIILSLTLLIFGGISQVKTVASLEQMMPKDIEEIKAFNTLRDNNLGQDMIAIVIETNRNSPQTNTIQDVTNYQVYKYISDLKQTLKQEQDILEVYAYSDLIEIEKMKLNFQNTSNLSNTFDKNTYNQITKNIDLSRFVNKDKTVSIILLTTDISANDLRMNLLSSRLKEIILDFGHPQGIKTSLTGTPIIQQKLGELISNDRTSTQWISTLLVFLITMLIFRSLTSAIVPILVVTLSVNFLYGTMGYTDLPISTLAGGVAAMVVGIGIDFAIHIMNKFKFVRKQGLSIKEATEASVVQTGMALSATSITTIVAFLSFLIGAMPEMGRFGILMAIGIFYSLVFSIFGLPAFLIIEEKILYAIKQKARFGIESEFKLNEIKGGKK